MGNCVEYYSRNYIAQLAPIKFINRFNQTLIFIIELIIERVQEIIYK